MLCLLGVKTLLDFSKRGRIIAKLTRAGLVPAKKPDFEARFGTSRRNQSPRNRAARFGTFLNERREER